MGDASIQPEVEAAEAAARAELRREVEVRVGFTREDELDLKYNYAARLRNSSP